MRMMGRFIEGERTYFGEGKGKRRKTEGKGKRKRRNGTREKGERLERRIRERKTRK